MQAKRTFDVPAGVAAMTVGVRGRFTGRVTVRDVALRVKR
jgi:hypothetical protein